jgi:hypothetical protein
MMLHVQQINGALAFDVLSKFKEPHGFFNRLIEAVKNQPFP